MEDKITYGVFWKTERNKEWSGFSCWHTTYESAFKDFETLALNPLCMERKIVERTEMFEDVINI